MATAPSDIELTEYEQRRIEDTIDRETDIDSSIAQIDLKIKMLESKKDELLEQKNQAASQRKELFQQIVEDNDIQPGQAGYTYEDGKLVKVSTAPEDIEIE